MSHSQAAAQALDDSEFPVQVQGALALTEMVTAYDEGNNTHDFAFYRN